MTAAAASHRPAAALEEPGSTTRRRKRQASPILLLSLLLLLLLATTLPAVAAFQSPKLPRQQQQQRRRRLTTTSMRARAKEEGPGNAEEANVYVDRSCAGCGTCRSLCPGVFGALGLRTVVERKPLDETETRAAYRAMVTCPVGAIRLRKPDRLVKEVVTHDFPTPLDPVALPGVYLLGYHNRESMGTTPYLIVREGGAGNVMIDAPRFNGRLALQIEAMGGVRYNIITHEGAAPHHDLWHAFFPRSERVVHRMDVTREMKGQVEGILQGKGPWSIDADVKIVGLPGYSPGAIGVIYYPPAAAAAAAALPTAAAVIGPSTSQNSNIEKAPSSSSVSSSSALEKRKTKNTSNGILFSGRTIGWSPRLNRLDGFAQFSRGSLQKQAESIRALGKEEFGWILPSEGLKYRVPEGGPMEAKERLLEEAAERFLERGRVGGLSM